MKRHSDTTLLHLTKAELIEYTRIAEYNQEVAEANLRQQAENIKDWEPVRHGTWNGKTLSTFLSLDHNGAPIYGYSPVYVCSCCERYSLLQTNYFPHCGAKMDGGEKDET